ncbi:MAG: hypothetical protein ACE5HC_17145, partial [Candidatus Binatia bacterium]
MEPGQGIVHSPPPAPSLARSKARRLPGSTTAQEGVLLLRKRRLAIGLLALAVVGIGCSKGWTG